MRLTRDKTKRAVRKAPTGRKFPRRWGTDGPGCPACAPHVNGMLKRATILSRIHAKEMEL